MPIKIWLKNSCTSSDPSPTATKIRRYCFTFADKVKNFRHPLRLVHPAPQLLNSASFFPDRIAIVPYQSSSYLPTVTPNFCVNFLVLFVLATCEITFTVLPGRAGSMVVVVGFVGAVFDIRRRNGMYVRRH